MKLFLYILLASVLIYFSLAVALIFSQGLQQLEGGSGIDFQNTSRQIGCDPGLSDFIARDGERLGVRHYDGVTADVPLVVLLHGSGWHGGAYIGLGSALNTVHGFEVLIPDLRGHGPAPTRRGDVDYIGQLEDDIADLLHTHGAADRPGFLVGHSSGGGLAIRFAGGQYGEMLNKVVLIAPFLNYDAPTARRADSGGGSGSGEGEGTNSWAHVLMRRLIGQIMLDSVGITAFNGLPVIQFSFPEHVLTGALGDTATPHYSYRLNTSFAPRNDYLADVAKLPEFLLIAGAQDEVFRSDAYESTLSAVNPYGKYHLLQGVSHLSVIDDAQAIEVTGQFLTVD